MCVGLPPTERYRPSDLRCDTVPEDVGLREWVCVVAEFVRAVSRHAEGVAEVEGADRESVPK